MDENNLSYPITEDMLGTEAEALDTGDMLYFIKDNESIEDLILKDSNDSLLYVIPEKYD